MIDDPYGETPAPRDLEPVGGLLDGVLARIGVDAEGGLTGVRRRWAEIAGPAWVEARPIKLTGGILVVEVPDGAKASRLQFDASRVATALSGVLGTDAVRTIRFRVSRRGPQ